MKRRELLATGGIILSTGCLDGLKSNDIPTPHDGQITVQERTCGEPSQSATGSAENGTASIEGQFGVEDTCQELDYSVFTTQNSREPKHVYVVVSPTNRSVEECESCRGTLAYTGEIVIAPEIDYIDLLHEVNGEQKDIARIDAR